MVHSTWFRLQTVRFRAQMLTHTRMRIRAKDTRCLCEQKKKETCLRSSITTLCEYQLNPHTLFSDTTGPTTVENVINEECVLAVLGSDCTMLKFP